MGCGGDVAGSIGLISLRTCKEIYTLQIEGK